MYNLFLQTILQTRENTQEEEEKHRVKDADDVLPDSSYGFSPAFNVQ